MNIEDSYEGAVRRMQRLEMAAIALEPAPEAGAAPSPAAEDQAERMRELEELAALACEDNERVKSELAAALQALDGERQELAAARGEVARVQVELAGAQAELAHAQQELGGVRDDNGQLRGYIATLQQTLASAHEAAAHAQQQQVAAAQQQVAPAPQPQAFAAPPEATPQQVAAPTDAQQQADAYAAQQQAYAAQQQADAYAAQQQAYAAQQQADAQQQAYAAQQRADAYAAFAPAQQADGYAAPQHGFAPPQQQLGATGYGDASYEDDGLDTLPKKSNKGAFYFMVIASVGALVAGLGVTRPWAKPYTPPVVVETPAPKLEPVVTAPAPKVEPVVTAPAPKIVPAVPKAAHVAMRPQREPRAAKAQSHKKSKHADKGDSASAHNSSVDKSDDPLNGTGL